MNETIYLKPWGECRIRHARKAGRCQWGPRCEVTINVGDPYIEPPELDPYKAGGFGTYRFCMAHLTEGDQ